jgi:hypothetical protein
MSGNQKQNKLVLKVLSTFLLLLSSSSSQALCLRDCSSEGLTLKSPVQRKTQFQPPERRQKSHNFGDNNTAIVGDMNIHVGHNRIDIRGMSDSKNSMIDASVTSVINLGGSK